jgi:hypothetical protein
MFFASDAINWYPLGSTDFGNPATSDTPLPAKLFVGPTYGAENGNIPDVPLKREWATRIRQYADVSQKPRGLADYVIGLNFAPSESGASLSSGDVAGVNYVAQANWNNVVGEDPAAPASGTMSSGIVADNKGKAEPTQVTVEFGSAGTWASQGPRGEQNNRMVPAADAVLMNGYLDTGNATTSHATISNIPASLVAGGYDVYVYFLGGVAGDRGGAYRILDATGNELKPYVRALGVINPTGFVEVPTGSTNYQNGNYIVFRGLKASSITVEGTTADGLGVGGTPRAPINAIQIASPVKPPRTYSIGLNFGSDQPNSRITNNAVAGAEFLAQQNWNNLPGQNGTNVTGIVADAAGAPKTNNVIVSWVSNNTWASTGIGEENNKFPAGGDRTILTGYLDTGNATTTSVTISNIPPALTSGGYDAVVYAMGGVGGRGGAFRVLDSVTKAVLIPYVKVVGATNSTGYVKVTSAPGSTNISNGNYIVFSGLTAPNITIEATTAGGQGISGTPRAPINAIQLTAPASATAAPSLKIERSGANVVITYSGTLQSADKVNGPYNNAAGPSPLTVTPSGAAKFYRSSQ